jgi:hypothetical protein
MNRQIYKSGTDKTSPPINDHILVRGAVHDDTAAFHQLG